VTHVYLEKPGAENAAQLSSMRELAAERGVAVVIGYNKVTLRF
jgi:predicted dehydrogenase